MRITEIQVVALLLAAAFAAQTISAQSAAPAAEAPQTPTAQEIEKRNAEEAARRALLERMARVRLRFLDRYEQNDRWLKEAMSQEKAIVLQAEERYEKRRYRDARKGYREALEITFPQWVFTDKVVAWTDATPQWHEQPDAVLALEKRNYRLLTEYTKLALARLERVDVLLQEEDLIGMARDAEQAFEAGKLGQAHRLFRGIADLARRIEGSSVAAAYLREAESRRESIQKEAEKLVAAAEAALAEKPDQRLLDLLAEIEDKFDDLSGFGLLRARYSKILDSPIVSQALREERGRNRLAIADAAYAKGDYRTAQRLYGSIVKTLKGTGAARDAEAKVKAMEANPEITEAIRLQEAESICKGLLARASAFAQMGKPEEACAVYDKIITEYPDTEWAKEAAEARTGLAATP